MSATEDPIVATRRGRVLLLALNRPQSSNALSPDLVNQLAAQLHEAGRDHAIDVVILTGSGRSFSAGLDLKHLGTLAPGGRNAYLVSVLEVFRQVWRLPQPMIAAVNGAAVAGGFDLSVFCDIRIAAEEAVFAQTEVLIGVNPISSPLHHLVGLGAAKELGYTGTKVSAREAHRIGLVNHVVAQAALLEKAFELADLIASRPRAAVQTTKRLIRESLDQPVDDAIEAAGKAILSAMDTDAHRAVLGEYVARLSSKPR